MAKFNRIKYIETALLRSNGELYTSPMTQLQKQCSIWNPGMNEKIHFYV